MRYDFLLALLPELEVIALEHFRSATLRPENKLDSGFDPVTIADKAIEARFREAILQEFPDDAILGEEFKSTDGKSGYSWVIDPIDGTRAFMIGAPSFTTLIALKSPDGFEASVISQPFTGERFICSKGQAFWQRGAERLPIATRAERELSQAVLASTFPEIGTDVERLSFLKVESQVKLTRYGMDAYAYGLLAMGQIDLVIEAGLNPFDYTAPWALIEAAGGVVSNWEGKPPQGKDRIIAAGNSILWEKALEALNS